MNKPSADFLPAGAKAHLPDGTEIEAQFTVDATVLRSVMAAAADKGNVRYYLCGVLLDLSESCIVATNGHIMARGPVGFVGPDAVTDLRKVPAAGGDIIMRFSKSPSKSATTIAVSLEHGMAWDVERTGKTHLYQVGLIDRPDSDGITPRSAFPIKYPEWQRVDVWRNKLWRPQREGYPFALHIPYLAKVLPGDTEITAPHVNGLGIRARGIHSPLRDVEVTIMPVRIRK